MQSGKQETSDLAGSILNKMKSQIAESVDISVNGRIKDIQKTLEEQNITMHEHFSKSDQHMESDKIWKEMYTPYIKGLASLSDGGKIIVYIIITLSAVGGAILAIRRWFL